MIGPPVTVPEPPTPTESRKLVVVGVETNASQRAVLPPLVPAQDHSQRPLSVTAEAVPVAHRFFVGAVALLVSLAVPH